MKKRKTREPRSYRSRTYRGVAERTGLFSTCVSIRETDLHILTDRDMSGVARDLAIRYRLQVEQYIEKKPLFRTSLIPLAEDVLAPPLIRDMIKAGLLSSVGPMAAVAGAIAEYVGKGLVEAGASEVIVENGGDIYLSRSCDCTVAVFAGESPLSNRVGIKLTIRRMPAGVCTSSGTVGHSLSFGSADSVTVLARSTALADAAATSIGNVVGGCKSPREAMARALEKAESIDGIDGVLVICDDLMGAAGEIEIMPVE